MTEKKQKCIKLVSINLENRHETVCAIIADLNKFLEDGWQVFSINSARQRDGGDLLVYTLIKYKD